MWKVSVTALVTIPVAREGHQLCTRRNGTNINRHHFLSTNKQMRYVSKPGCPIVREQLIIISLLDTIYPFKGMAVNI